MKYVDDGGPCKNIFRPDVVDGLRANNWLFVGTDEACPSLSAYFLASCRICRVAALILSYSLPLPCSIRLKRSLKTERCQTRQPWNRCGPPVSSWSFVVLIIIHTVTINNYKYIDKAKSDDRFDTFSRGERRRETLPFFVELAVSDFNTKPTNQPKMTKNKQKKLIIAIFIVCACVCASRCHLSCTLEAKQNKWPLISTNKYWNRGSSYRHSNDFRWYPILWPTAPLFFIFLPPSGPLPFHSECHSSLNFLLNFIFYDT